ncbi:transposase [Streptomyces sp. NPDC086549]|uniref:transposase n=1 Tax=Streptomyces sp. NPDC086549 TaxID=3365752 RepID=UPI0037F85301
MNDGSSWPVDKLSELRLGRRQAFVDVRPKESGLDAQAQGEGWVRSDAERSFHLEHWEYDRERKYGNAAQLHREIQTLGYPGGELAVQRHLRRYRLGRGHAPAVGPKPPSVREVTSWIMAHPEHLCDGDAGKLHRLRERDPELNRLTGHVRKFAAMMTGRHGDRLDGWITAAEQDTLVPLASFARNLRRDLNAVRNGLSLPYSSSAVEGNINRLKMLKRQMFGRAGLGLLRKRVLLAR